MFLKVIFTDPKMKTNSIRSSEDKFSVKRKREAEIGNDVPKLVKNKARQISDEYLSVVGEMMYPKSLSGTYGYIPEESRLSLHKVSSLGYLLNPLRLPTVFEKWNPFEIAVFESSMTVYGKNFHQVQKQVKSKTVKEIIEFYYAWKKTSHYIEWKKIYIPDERDTPTVLVES